MTRKAITDPPDLIGTFAAGYRRGLASGIDLLEALDANNECAHGRLPGYQGTACACWQPTAVEVPRAT
jgi:hypothetical protein